MSFSADYQVLSERFDQLRPELEQRHGMAMGQIDILGRIVLAPEAGLSFRFRGWPEYMQESGVGPGMAQFGAIILADLNAKSRLSDPPVNIPRVLDMGYTPNGEEVEYICLSYLPGQSLSYEESQELTPGLKAAFGRTVADCAIWMANNVPNDAHWCYFGDEHFRENQQVVSHMPPHIRAFDHAGKLAWALQQEGKDLGLDADRFPTFTSVLDGLRTSLNCQPDVLDTPIFGHYDLRPANFLFEDGPSGPQATGLIDFEVGRPSSYARELRSLPLVGNEALAAGVSRIAEVTGQDLDEDDVYMHSRLHMAGSALTALRRGWQVHEQIRSGLRNVYPQLDWSELEE